MWLERLKQSESSVRKELSLNGKGRVEKFVTYSDEQLMERKTFLEAVMPSIKEEFQNVGVHDVKKEHYALCDLYYDVKEEIGCIKKEMEIRRFPELNRLHLLSKTRKENALSFLI